MIMPFTQYLKALRENLRTERLGGELIIPDADQILRRCA